MAKGNYVKIKRGDIWGKKGVFANGKSIREYIERQFDLKVGYIPRNLEKEEDGNYHIRGFRDEEAYNEWKTDPELYAENVLFEVLIPEMSGSAGGVSYVVTLRRDGTGDIITQNNDVKIRVRATSQQYNPISGEKEDTGEGVILTVQTRLNASSTWATKGTLDIETLPADSQGWTTIDLTDMLSTGTQQVRIIAKGQETGASSTYLSFSVTKTTLGVSFATQWEKPVTDDVMRLQFYIYGAVSKTLHLLIDGKRKTERNVGTAVYTETPLQIDLTDGPTDSDKVLTHGIHTIEAWLAVNDSDVESGHIHCQVLVIADKEDRTPYLILNDIAPKLTNYTEERIFSYALYNPTGEPMPLKFVLTDYRGAEQYMTIDTGMVNSGERHTLDNKVEIESESETIGAYMRFYSGDREIHDMVGFEVDNTERYAPTPGADFILNPRSRTNAEQEPQSIINQATGQIVPSRWEGFGMSSDGWTRDKAGNQCLSVPAGRRLDIEYEAFTDFIGTDNRSSLTIEMEVATRNNTLAVDPETGKLTEVEDPILRMCSYLQSDGGPLGFELKPTSASMLTQNKRETEDQNIIFEEGARTHIAINIIHGIYGTDQNYIRFFVNGCIAREFAWQPDDAFVQYVDGKRTSQGIRIGSDTCDIDIYGMRVYKKALSAGDIRKDYEASLPSVEEKRAFREANDILGDDGFISFAKVSAKYNYIVVKAPEIPRYGHNITVEGEIIIKIQDDPRHSGIIKLLKKIKGQGTSSMGYWVWNLSFAEFLEFINELGESFEGYALDDTVPEAKKLVLKINYASSMQSHKMGSVNLYDDLYRRIVGTTPITSTPGFEKSRMSVKQKPFFVFVQTPDDAEPRFHCLGTFGPGKGDKPTYGYDKAVFPDYMLVEGCDNGAPLPGFRIPWNDDITRGGDEQELFMYNGSKNLEIDLGESEKAIEGFKKSFNFVYLCYPFLHPFVGTLEQLQADTSLNKQHLYWVTEASGSVKKFDLFRYDPLTSKWVDAGVEKLGVGLYEKLNLTEQLGIEPAGVMWDDINRQFKEARVAKFRDGVETETCFKVQAFIFCMMYGRFQGLTDNWVKNAYYRFVLNLIEPKRDDDDTMRRIDNVGRMTTPYWAEEHDMDTNGGYYFNGNEAGLWNLLEMAFSQECRTMMRTILTEMANLSDDGTVMGCLEKYFLSTQKYFPAVAYNETARLLYESAALAREQGTYTNETDPLSQSLGRQLESERAWLKQRVIYMSSYAGYGQFAYNGEGRLSWRSIMDREGRMPEYSFKLTPFMWLYPTVNAGQTSFFGRGKGMPQRVKAGEEYELGGLESDGNTQIQLLGADYYCKIGDFSDKPLEADFTVMGERLMEFTASKMPKEFRPTRVAVADSAVNLEKFDISGCESVRGSISFNNQPRLKTLNLKGTSITSFSVLYPTAVTELRLPSTLTTLRLENYTSLTQEGFETEGAQRVQTFVFRNCPRLSSQLIVSQMCQAAENDWHEVSIDGIDWVDFPVAYLMKLAAVKADLRGRIKLSGAPTFEEKMALMEAFGNIDDEGNRLYLDYEKYYLTSIELTGDSYYGEPGQYRLTMIPNSPRANNFKSIEWAMTANSVGATIDKATGLITIPRIGSDVEKPSATVSVKAECSDGSSLASSMQVWFYYRECEVGDWVFSDGSFSPTLNKAKTPIGVCFYINPKDKTQRLLVALEELPSQVWGLTNFNDIYGFTSIILQDDPLYDVFDTPLPSINPDFSILVDSPSYRDINSPDGFAYKGISNSFGRIGFFQLNERLEYRGEQLGKKDDFVPIGLYNTITVLNHRNKILMDSGINLEVPKAKSGETEMECLNRLIADLQLKNGGLTKYAQFYYPALSVCHAYRPNVGYSELAEKFEVGKWFLPASGDIARLCWFWLQDNLEDPELPIFKDKIESGLMQDFNGQASYCSSDEFSKTDSVPFYFSNKTFGQWGAGACRKHETRRIRPICAF